MAGLICGVLFGIAMAMFSLIQHQRPLSVVITGVATGVFFGVAKGIFLPGNAAGLVVRRGLTAAGSPRCRTNFRTRLGAGGS